MFFGATVDADAVAPGNGVAAEVVVVAEGIAAAGAALASVCAVFSDDDDVVQRMTTSPKASVMAAPTATPTKVPQREGARDIVCALLTGSSDIDKVGIAGGGGRTSVGASELSNVVAAVIKCVGGSIRGPNFWLMAVNVRAISFIDENRSAGFLAKARSKNSSISGGNDDKMLVALGMGSLQTCMMIMPNPFPVNGRRPVSMRYRITPKDQISAR